MNTKCFLCNSDNHKVLHKGVRDNECIDVLKCSECSLEFLSDFSHINKSFYEKGLMHNKEIDKWIKNTYCDDFRRFKFLEQKIQGKKVLDFGCGNGGFVKLAQCDGVEIDESMKEYFDVNGLCVYSSIDNLKQAYDYITLFHVVEHLKNPIEILNGLKSKLAKDGRLIIEVPNCNDALISLYKSKSFEDFTYWSCHLFNYNECTLSKVLEKSGYRVIKTEFIQRYPYTNHLYWFFKKSPAGHEKLKHLYCRALNDLYCSFLKRFKITDTLIVEAEKV